MASFDPPWVCPLCLGRVGDDRETGAAHHLFRHREPKAVAAAHALPAAFVPRAGPASVLYRDRAPDLRLVRDLWDLPACVASPFQEQVRCRCIAIHLSVVKRRDKTLDMGIKSNRISAPSDRHRGADLTKIPDVPCHGADMRQRENDPDLFQCGQYAILFIQGAYICGKPRSCLRKIILSVFLPA